jgi:hypothetical protein
LRERNATLQAALTDASARARELVSPVPMMIGSRAAGGASQGQPDERTQAMDLIEVMRRALR